MATPKNLLFSQFKVHEFEQICQLLCSVFKTTPEELSKLYHSIGSTFDEPGWPLHFVSRDFFQSSDYSFRTIYQRSPVISVDLPSLMELNDGKNNKPTVAIIGQDSKQNSDHLNLLIGTPYGLHHKGSREELSRTKLYFEMIQVDEYREEKRILEQKIAELERKKHDLEDNVGPLGVFIVPPETNNSIN